MWLQTDDVQRDWWTLNQSNYHIALSNQEHFGQIRMIQAFSSSWSSERQIQLSELIDPQIRDPKLLWKANKGDGICEEQKGCYLYVRV